MDWAIFFEIGKYRLLNLLTNFSALYPVQQPHFILGAPWAKNETIRTQMRGWEISGDPESPMGNSVSVFAFPQSRQISGWSMISGSTTKRNGIGSAVYREGSGGVRAMWGGPGLLHPLPAPGQCPLNSFSLLFTQMFQHLFPHQCLAVVKITYKLAWNYLDPARKPRWQSGGSGKVLFCKPTWNLQPLGKN